MKTHYVYIIKSETSKRYYTGISKDFNRRLVEHNEGKNSSTRGKGPWQLEWTSTEMTKSEALALERRIKKRGAGRYLLGLNE